MKVKELIKLLKKFNQEDIVIMSSDSEGNYHSPLSSITVGSYRADNPYSGTAGILELTPALIKAGFTEEDVLDEPCVILGPTS